MSAPSSATESSKGLSFFERHLAPWLILRAIGGTILVRLAANPAHLPKCEET